MTAKPITEPSESSAAISAAQQGDAQLALAMIDLMRALVPTGRNQQLKFRNSIRRSIRNRGSALAFHRQILEAALKIR